MRAFLAGQRLLRVVVLAMLLGVFPALQALAVPGDVATPARRALVIGIDGYSDPDLHIPGKRTGEDAIEVARVLGEVAGYDTVLTVPRDADRRAFAKVLSDFAATIDDGDLVVVFYSGHGVEFGGDNYFLLSDAVAPLPASAIETENELRASAISQRGLVETLRQRHPGNIVLVVNACRNDVGPSATLGTSDGDFDFPAPSARVPADPGTMVIYATSSGKPARVCLDRDCSTDLNPMTVFTRRFVAALQKPNLAARDLSDEVGAAVEAEVRASVGEVQLVSVDDQISYAAKRTLFLGPVAALPPGSVQVPDPVPASPGPDRSEAIETARRCGELAAPEWSTHFSGGVSFEAIEPELALAACTAARTADAASTDVETWLARAFMADGQYGTAMPLLNHAAAAGNDDAQVILAVALQGGNGIAPDLSRAVQLLTAAAAGGHAVAEAGLGLLYQLGEGVPQDYEEAARLFRLAADKGNVDAQFALGYLYDEGLGVPASPALALRYYVLAAAQSNALAQYALGTMYESGRGVPQSDEDARRYYELAMILGLDEANDRLLALGE